LATKRVPVRKRAGGDLDQTGGGIAAELAALHQRLDAIEPDAWAELQRLAAERVEKMPKLTPEQAMAAVLGTPVGQDLYARYEEQRRAGQVRRREEKPPLEPTPRVNPT
jgi:hypothetical protein